MEIKPPALTAVGAFAGIGGVELGLQTAGIESKVLIENWEPAKAVLGRWFPGADLLGDIREVRSLPLADVLAGGFPCTDLSQAGRTAGINGQASGLVRELLRLLPVVRPTWLVLENVRNMLVLDGGRAMEFLVTELESMGYRWAYRLVDSRSFGVPQRRQRVLLVASRIVDARPVLFSDDAGEPPDNHFADDAFGFYWTEGLRGLGWARDAVPTLKGGSAVGIPSPPAIWVLGAQPGRRIVKPAIEDAERMQGFSPGWTEVVGMASRRSHAHRWKMVGNAVTVGASEWLGRRLVQPGEYDGSLDLALPPGAKWPAAAWGERGLRFRTDRSMWPVRQEYQHLLSIVDPATAEALSHRATTGFLSRLERSTLRIDHDFMLAIKEHAAVAGQ